ncbi:MAG: MFS transporter [Acidobacteriota bacterium]|nr:MFS transporter [Acidobacteriota bacterium]MDQ7086903.1 MFS transporter [Acidobacteriota bacterium]
MSTSSPSIWKRFPRAFWAANTMEIFERMGWYGFYAVSSLYLTGAVADGGLGLSSQDRGVIQALVTFFLYLFPAFFGALADRYGYRRMFLASCAVMIPAYLLLGHPRTFWTFFAVYMLVAIGHGMFKPVVIGTVARTTDATTGTLGFGIFYMMVNIGGFLGPIAAGVVRGWSWRYVFYASAGWIVLLGLTCLLFYREPEGRQAGAGHHSLGRVVADMIAVIGNFRFFLLVAGEMLILVLGAKWLEPGTFLGLAAAWLLLNLGWDALLRARGIGGGGPLTRPMEVGEGRYLVFLLLMAGFWTSFNQIFMTLPEYIRDYVDTSDLVGAFGPLGRWIMEAFHNDFFLSLGIDSSTWARGVLEHGQIKPEHLINLNALGIILGQVAISYLARNLRPFTTIISGVLITAISFLVYLGGAGGFWIVVGVLVFSVGEMLASPKSKEYAGRIAPPDKVGLYMGYFYWCVALGNLFGGLLSGVMYQYFGPKGIDRPGVMWLAFAALALVSTVALAVYNAWLQRQDAATRREP